MIELHFVHPKGRMRRIYHADRVVLGPALKSEEILEVWSLPWQEGSQLHILNQGEGYVAINLTGDPAIQLNGLSLVSSPIEKGDLITIGRLNILFNPEANIEIPPLEKEPLPIENIIRAIDTSLSQRRPLPTRKVENKKIGRRKNSGLASAITSGLCSLIITLCLMMSIARTHQDQQSAAESALAQMAATIDSMGLERPDYLKKVKYRVQNSRSTQVPVKLIANPKKHKSFHSPSPIVVESFPSCSL